MNANAHSARNGPRRWFSTAIAIAGMASGLVAASASPPLVNEQAAIPKAGLVVKNDSGQKIQAAETSPGATIVVGANQLSQFDVANHAFGGAINSPNELAPLASNNGVNVTESVAAVINRSLGFAYNTGNSDPTFVANAVTSLAPLNTSPPTAAVGCLASANIAQVESEGGVGYGTTLVVTGTGTDPGVVLNRAAKYAQAA